MELGTNSWGDTIMIALRERILEINGSAEGVAPAKPWAVTGTDSAERAQFLADELESLRRDHAKLQQAIFEAAQVQRKLCAPRELNWGQFEIAGEIFPVRHLSGDFFKVMKLRSALGVAVGDIAGKGLSAGIWQAHLMGLIQRSARRHTDPAAALAEVNDELCGDDGQPPLTALFFARIDATKSELVYCNAGLPAPLLLRSNNALERLETGGPMLGALQNANFNSERVVFHPGDMLVAYSDGVTESRNAQDQEFEMNRLENAARGVAGTNASKALFSLVGTVLDFADACSLADDLTLLVLRRNDAVTGDRSRSRKRKVSGPRREQASRSRPRNTDRGDTVPNS